ncbi:MAG: hypothetical protein DI543_14080 [Bradyrhizobium icense]|nr:MAG: hypothetical protein DI543_14080 [Bradyrhizobium icense]
MTGANSGLSRAGRIGRPKTDFSRHARPCAGHPRLFLWPRRGWPGHRRAEATPSFGRLCPAMSKFSTRC